MIKKLIIFTLLIASILNAATLNLNKNTFTTNEQIIVSFAEMSAQNDDWIAIYEETSNNSWVNVINWQWTNDIAAGNLTFDALPVGNYEVRAFYNNSYQLEASKKFNVELNTAPITSVTTDKVSYVLGEEVTATFTNMSGDEEDWIAIYPAGSSNSWVNNVQAKWTNAEINGTQIFTDLPIGEYEVRVFFNGTYGLEASHPFSIIAAPVAPTVTTDKEIYNTTEEIIATFNDMSGDIEDWIAIYPAESSTAWENMLQWEWTNGEIEGSQTFEPLPVGNYEVRVFFNNSAQLKGSYPFSVEDTEFNLESRKVAYDPFELIHADFVNMRGTGSDWLGVFPVGAGHAKENAIQWKYANSLVDGNVSFNGLPIGTYEMRAYFATLHKKTVPFTVQDTAVTKIEYEDAEGGFDQVWEVYQNPSNPVTIINTGAAGSAHSIRAVAYVSSSFSFSDPDKKLRFLEFDTRVGAASHVGNFGVIIKTKNGNRRVVFSSYMNHPGNVFTNDPDDFQDPFTSGTNGTTHNHPGPTDYYMETNTGNFIHYKINIEEKLRILEPDNELLGMTHFTSAGGDFDNIQLVSH